MQIADGKNKFIEEWGRLGISWGINKSMAQTHALLLISSKPMTAEDVKAELGISAGSANISLNTLMEWELISKMPISGSRKDHFVAEKDMWTIFSKIIINRKKRELDPMVSLLDHLSDVEVTCPESNEFHKVLTDLRHFSQRADKALINLSSFKSKWILSGAMKMMR